MSLSTPTIYAIEAATREKAPFFFTRDTLQFFGQTRSSFSVWKGASGAVYIAAPSYWKDRQTGRKKLMGITFRRFTGDDLDTPEHPDFMKSMELAKQWVKTAG